MRPSSPSSTSHSLSECDSRQSASTSTGCSPVRKKNRNAESSSSSSTAAGVTDMSLLASAVGQTSFLGRTAEEEQGLEPSEEENVSVSVSLFPSQLSQPFAFTQDSQSNADQPFSSQQSLSIGGGGSHWGRTLFSSQDSLSLPHAPSSLQQQQLSFTPAQSQLSQDFAQRLALQQMMRADEFSSQISFDGPSHNNNNNNNNNNNDASVPHAVDKKREFSLPLAPCSKLPRSLPTHNSTHNPHATHTNGTTKQASVPMVSVEVERQVELHPVMANPFLSFAASSSSSSSATTTTTVSVWNSPAERYVQTLLSIPRFQSLRSVLPKLTKVFVSPYQERSRYLSDFEELLQIGTGTFSKVSCVRHRLDGMLYAVKIVREHIGSKKQEALLLREVNALSLLTQINCPHIIRYYGSWIEDAQLFLQLELCHVGSLEDLISPRPSKSSVFFTQIVSEKNDVEVTHGNPHSAKNSVHTLQRYFSASAMDQGLREREGENEADMCTPASEMMNVDTSSIALATPRCLVTPTNSLVFPHSSTNGNAAAVHKLAGNDAFLSQPSRFAFESINDFTPQTQMDGQEAERDNMSARGVHEEVAWRVLAVVAETLECMHRRGLVHLDLRPANLFLQESTSGCMSYAEALAMSSSFSSSSSSSVNTTTAAAPPSLFAAVMGGGGPSITGKTTLTQTTTTPVLSVREEVEQGIISGKYVIKVGDLGHCRGVFERGMVNEGENRYCPRELINSDPNQLDLTKSDIFSLGASVYELCLGRFLGSSGEEEMLEWHSIRDGNLHDAFLKKYSPPLCTLIQQALHVDPQRRPSASQLCELCCKR